MHSFLVWFGGYCAFSLGCAALWVLACVIGRYLTQHFGHQHRAVEGHQ